MELQDLLLLFSPLFVDALSPLTSLQMNLV